MKLNKFMFSEEFAFTYEEVLDALGYTAPFDSAELCLLLVQMGYIVKSGENVQYNYYEMSFIQTGVSADVSIQTNALNVLNKLRLRYGEHYAMVLTEDTASVISAGAKSFMRKVFNVLDYTYDKYNTLLSIYAEQKSHLLDKLEKTRNEDKSAESEVSSTSSSNSKSAGSNTPQTINVSADYGEIAGYFDEYNQAGDEAESHSEGANEETNEITETFDPSTLMARIEEIQTKYENTMFKWVEEFDRLFIEEGNI